MVAGILPLPKSVITVGCTADDSVMCSRWFEAQHTSTSPHAPLQVAVAATWRI